MRNTLKDCLDGRNLARAEALALADAEGDEFESLLATAAEVRDPRRTLPRALLIGTGLVVLLYLLSNLAYLAFLPVAGVPDGATALAWAVHLGERRMAQALIDSGANANTADEYGETPVTLAAANGDAGLVQRLVAAGGNAGAARWNGETAVMIEAGAGSLDLVLRDVARLASAPRGR